MENDTIIDLREVTLHYDRKVVLQGVNLSINRGDFMGMIGPNGSGKTTLIKAILGLHEPTSGTIEFYDQSGEKSSNITLGYLPQQNNIDKRFPISVSEVILSGLISGNRRLALFRPTKEEQQRVNQTIEQMGLSGLGKRPIGQLSGGQLQRTLLGRAVVSNPDVLILDEPNSYIDLAFEEKMYEILLGLNTKSTVVMVSHDVTSVLAYAKTIACVNGNVHTHPNRELPPDWIHTHFTCPIERYEARL